MGWTVIIEDENGNAKRTMPKEFILSDEEILNNDNFKLLKYTHTKLVDEKNVNIIQQLLMFEN